MANEKISALLEELGKELTGDPNLDQIKKQIEEFKQQFVGDELHSIISYYILVHSKILLDHLSEKLYNELKSHPLYVDQTYVTVQEEVLRDMGWQSPPDETEDPVPKKKGKKRKKK